LGCCACAPQIASIGRGGQDDRAARAEGCWAACRDIGRRCWIKGNGRCRRRGCTASAKGSRNAVIARSAGGNALGRCTRTPNIALGSSSR
jgi:hypothetical protein